METPVFNKIPLVRKTLIGWIILGMIYISIVIFTSIQSEHIPQKIAIVWGKDRMPILYETRTFLISITIIPSTLITAITTGFGLLPFYNSQFAFIPFKKFWLSLVNIEKTSFIGIWLSLFIGISSNMLSFSLFYPLWIYNMNCLDSPIEQCQGNYIFIPQIIIFVLTVLSYLLVVFVYFYNPPQKEGQLIENGDLEEEGGWKHEVLYFNPFNPELCVHKRLGMGWTFNWGNPWSPIILMMIFMFLSVLSMLLCIFLPTL